MISHHRNALSLTALFRLTSILVSLRPRRSPFPPSSAILFRIRYFFCGAMPDIITADSHCKLDLVLPEDLFQVVWEALVSKTESIQYAKVFLPLSALLEGDFFNIYIKSGTIYRIYLPYISNLFSDIVRQCSHAFRRTSRCR